MAATEPETGPAARTAPDFRDLLRVFARIGCLSFGGPAAQIALMHRELVEDRPWLSERQFLSALSFCMLLPGPEAMQLATYAGWKLRGVAGGLLAGSLFVIPGAIVIAALALLYIRIGAQPETSAILLGVKAAVIVIVIQALMRLWQKALTQRDAQVIATLSFLAIFVFQVPFPVIILAAALFGAWRSRGAPPSRPDQGAPGDRAPPARLALPVATVALWLGLWLAPLAVLAATGHDMLFALAAFFAKLAVVTFGGAYAVLAYMAQEVVQTNGWLDAAQMVDALGLAETTPGPLILVTQFVGMVAGHAEGGTGLALLAGVLTLWMTFVPCFLWIFAGAPFIDTLLGRPRLHAAMSAITAAVVGVILNLSVWFASHVLFAERIPVPTGLGRIDLPVLASLDAKALALVALAAVLLWPLRRGVLSLLAICGLGGWALGLA